MLNLTMCPLIIDFVESVIAFLTCGVPNGELYLSALPKLNDLCEATRVNRTYLLVVEAALAKTESQRGFTHTCYIKVISLPVNEYFIFF